MDKPKRRKRGSRNATIQGLIDRLAMSYEPDQIEPLLRALLDHLPEMVWVKDAHSLNFLYLNPAGEQLVGWTLEHHHGQNVHHFYPADQAMAFDAQDRAAIASGRMLLVPEAPIETRTGPRWLRTRKVPIFDEAGRPRYLLGIAEDVTEEHLARTRARELEGELGQIVQAAREAIVTWEPDGRIATWNPGAEALYGRPAARAIGTSIFELTPPTARAAFEAAQRALRDGKPVAVAETTRLRDGAEIEIEESLFLIRDAAGQPARFGSIARDVTELARLRRAAELLGADESRGQSEPALGSPRMRAALGVAEIAARDANATVLITGETGTGKGWLARRIHAQSPRARAPFLEINCASLSPALLESELFGHERGAFTGANEQKRGLVEAAAGGTLFLDEIGEMPLAAQAQLLTFLDRRTFRRVGGLRTLASDVRLLAATNVDLLQAGDRGVFRRDLYYRLSVLSVELPPLRERREDLAELARGLLADLGRGARISSDALGAIVNHDWPGNVRELRNALERGLILSRGAPIELSHLPPELRGHGPTTRAESVAAVERQHIERVLDECGGNRTRAARRLGIGLATLKRRLAAWRRST